MSLMTLHLAKQNFKFSAAHFLIFDEKRAERLHGHNYQVKVDIQIPETADLKTTGYFVDFNIFKKHVKDRLDSWDEFILLPENNTEMKFKKNPPSLEVNFRDRFYVFPMNEVKLLPVTNTSVEQFSRLLAEDFLKEFQKHGVHSVQVWVEETQGQAASCRIEI